MGDPKPLQLFMSEITLLDHETWQNQTKTELHCLPAPRRQMPDVST